jgi:hypothetical protein
MLNWIDKNERLPTKEDASQGGYIYGVPAHGMVSCVHLDHFETVIKSFTHWLPYSKMPVPKRWRTPTIHDLAKAGKPIPCRMRDTIAMEWARGELCAINAQIQGNHCCGRAFMSDSGSWYYLCEICDD